MSRFLLFLMCGLFLIAMPYKAKSDGNKKVQDVSFDGSSVDGVVRTPDGLYLVQKRGIEFLPLYKVRKKFDKSIKESVEYLR